MKASSTSKEHQLPVRGPKICSDEEVDKKELNKLIDSKIDEHKSLFVAECPRHNRSLAEWDLENRQIVVKKRIGKVFRYFGTQNKNGYTLLPEEAAFLLESNYLELRWNSVPLSVEQTHAILLDENNIYCKLMHYRIYTQLLRENYRLFRHKSVDVEINENNELALSSNASDLSPPKKKLKSNVVKTINPLINELDTLNSDTVIEKLQVFNKNLKVPKTNILYIYDGFNPSREIKKSDLSDPDFVVSSTRPDDFLPTVKFEKESNNTPKLLIGMEGGRNVIFYNIQHVQIENLIK